MYAVVLKYESIILTIHAFISKLLPVGVTITVAVTVGGVIISVIRKGPVISKIGNRHDHECYR